MAGAKEQSLASYMNVHHKENCNTLYMTWQCEGFYDLIFYDIKHPNMQLAASKMHIHELWHALFMTKWSRMFPKKSRIKYQHLLSYHLSLLLAHLSNLLHPFFPIMNASRHFRCKKNKSKSTTFKRAFYLKGANFGVCIVKTKTQQ